MPRIVGRIASVQAHRPAIPSHHRRWFLGRIVMPIRCMVIIVLGICLAPVLRLGAAEPKTDTSRGDKQLEAYFRRETQVVADACLAYVATRADWEKRRPELRRQFLDMMGLWPLPPRTDLRAVVTGKLDAETFTVEKLH